MRRQLSPPSASLDSGANCGVYVCRGGGRRGSSGNDLRHRARAAGRSARSTRDGFRTILLRSSSAHPQMSACSKAPPTWDRMRACSFRSVGASTTGRLSSSAHGFLFRRRALRLVGTRADPSRPARRQPPARRCVARCAASLGVETEPLLAEPPRASSSPRSRPQLSWSSASRRAGGTRNRFLPRALVETLAPGSRWSTEARGRVGSPRAEPYPVQLDARRGRRLANGARGLDRGDIARVRLRAPAARVVRVSLVESHRVQALRSYGSRRRGCCRRPTGTPSSRQVRCRSTTVARHLRRPSSSPRPSNMGRSRLPSDSPCSRS